MSRGIMNICHVVRAVGLALLNSQNKAPKEQPEPLSSIVAHQETAKPKTKTQKKHSIENKNNKPPKSNNLTD